MRGGAGHLAFQSPALDLNEECGTECSSCTGMCNNRASIAVQGRVQYLVDKVDQIRETALLLESGTSLPCYVLVNARESKLSLIICSGCAFCQSSRHISMAAGSVTFSLQCCVLNSVRMELPLCMTGHLSDCAYVQRAVRSCINLLTSRSWA